jgi:3-oxoacyl-(acyl-carrier-protein) synthase
MDGGCRLVGGTAQPAQLSVALSNGFGFGGFNSSLVLAAVA